MTSNAARPMHGAVFFPSGSARKFFRGNALNSLRTAFNCSATVTISVRSLPPSESTRSAVSSRRVLGPKSLSSCFGLRERLSGQKRVPLPPAMMTL